MSLSKKSRFGLLFLVFIAGAVAVIGWLLYSPAGRDFILTQAQKQLPDGARLQWQRVDGVFADGLRFNRLVYADAEQRYEAGLLEIDADILPLLFRHVNIAHLRAEHVRLHLKKDDTPFEFPRWPESLPELDLPLRIRVADARISDMQLFEQNRLLYSVTNIRGGLELAPGALMLDHLQAESVHGQISVNGDYRPNRGYATRLDGTVRLRTEAAGTPPALRLHAEGDAERFLFDLEGALPEPVRIRWELSTRDGRPFWVLGASGERFEPAMLGLADAHAYRVQLGASGDDRRSQIAGELSRDAKTLVIEPSRFALDGSRILLEDVHLQYAGARLSAQGSLNTEGELSSDALVLQVSDFVLPLAEKDSAKTKTKSVPVVLSTRIEASGKLSAWQLKVTGSLLRGKERASFDVLGNGTGSALDLPKMKVNMAQGGLDGRLRLRWQPAMDIAFEGKLIQFDPAYFFADYPGAVNADLRIAVQQPAGKDWRGTVKVLDLGGQLRGRRLAGRADLHFNGLTVSGDADLHAGASHVTLRGGDSGKLDVAAAMLPLDLNDISPTWSGLVRGTLVLQGDKKSPDYRVDVQGGGLQMRDYRVGKIRLLGGTLGDGHTRLDADDIWIDGQLVDRIALDLDGPLRESSYRLSAQSGEYALDSSGDLQWQDGITRLRPEFLRTDGGVLGIWQLQQPALLMLDGSGYQFTPLCLASTDHSARLCAEDDGNLIAVNGNDFPMSLLQPWVNNAGKEFTYSGTAALRAELPKSFAVSGSGFVDLDVPLLKVGVKPNDANEVIRIEDLRLQLKWLANRLAGEVFARLPEGGLIEGTLDTGFSPSAPLNGGLKLQINELSWLELFSLDLAQPTGRINGEIEISGRRDAPSINGAYRLQDFNVQIPGLGLKLADGQLTANSTDNLAMLVKGSIRSGDGRLSVVGVWDPADQLPQPIDLRLIGKNVTLADTPNTQLSADTDLLLGYAGGIYSLNGDINLLDGQVNLETLSSSVAISNDVVVVDSAPEKAKRDLLRLGLKLKVGVSEHVKVTGYGLDGAVSGRVTVDSPYGSPTKLTGTLSLGGKYAAYGKELIIKRGNLQYSNNLVYEPRLDILTERVIEEENITVGLQLSGPAAKPKTTVVSNPSMSDSDALSWLLFGRPLNAVSAGQADSINAKSMALNAGGSFLVGTLGRKVGLDEASISESRALGDSTLTIGKQISPRLFVSYGVSLLGIGQVITLKYLLKAGLDISIESEQSELREQSSAALNWRK